MKNNELNKFNWLTPTASPAAGSAPPPTRLSAARTPASSAPIRSLFSAHNRMVQVKQEPGMPAQIVLTLPISTTLPTSSVQGTDSKAPVSVKEEVDSDSGDSFDEFPIGAVRYTREELFARMEARRQADGNVIQDSDVIVPANPDAPEVVAAPHPMNVAVGAIVNTPDDDDGNSFDQFSVAEILQRRQTTTPKTETSDDASGHVSSLSPQRGSEGPERSPTPTPTDFSRLMPVVKQEEPLNMDQVTLNTVGDLLRAHGTISVSIRKNESGIKIEAITPEKGTPEVTDSQESSVSSVITPRRRLRVIDPSDDEESDGQEEQNGDEENEITPKKKGKKLSPMVTPSPAKRLRTLNINRRHQSDEEEDDSDDDAAIDDSMADESPFNDSQADPEYFPETQDLVDRPADFRIPKSAPKDPLDLKY